MPTLPPVWGFTSMPWASLSELCLTSWKPGRSWLNPVPKNANKRAKVLDSKLIYKGRVFELRHDRVSEPDGVLTERDIIVHPGSVVVLPVFPDGTALLVRQYRHAANDYLWELVAGSMDKPGELPGMIELVEMNAAAEAAYTRCFEAARDWDGRDPLRSFDGRIRDA